MIYTVTSLRECAPRTVVAVLYVLWFCCTVVDNVSTAAWRLITSFFSSSRRACESGNTFRWAPELEGCHVFHVDDCCCKMGWKKSPSSSASVSLARVHLQDALSTQEGRMIDDLRVTGTWLLDCWEDPACLFCPVCNARRWSLSSRLSSSCSLSAMLTASPMSWEGSEGSCSGAINPDTKISKIFVRSFLDLTILISNRNIVSAKPCVLLG